MKRSAHTANSPSNETPTNNNHSPKRSCTEKNPKNCAASNSTAAASSSLDNISCSIVSSSTTTEPLNMDENIETLVSMGFNDRDLNRRALNKADNDISEAVTFLTGNTFFTDDVIIPAETTTTTMSTFIGPLTKEQLEQQQMVSSNNHPSVSSTMSSEDLTQVNSNSFTTTAFLDLETKVYGDNWSIPYKRDEVLGRCLQSATKFALAGTADQDEHCKKFMEILIPDAFRKLQCSHYVNNWGIEVQSGVFDMVELLVDLIAARLSYSPVPVQLLETIAVLFDHDSVFHRKHRSKPYDRALYDKQLGDRLLAVSPSPSFPNYNRNEPYGWLCQIINRFVFKDGVQNLKKQFKSEQPLTAIEYNALFAPFVNCMEYISIERYRQLFNEHLEQALDYVKNLKEDDFKAKSTYATFELLSTLRKLCTVVWTDRLGQVEDLHLNLLLKMVALANFNAKMNSLKELAKIIENSTSNIPSISKTSIARDVVSEWIIENSILSKALEGNIDQNQYVEKVRTLMDFIAPRILKEDIETIWRMQHGRSLVAVDHLFTLIASAAAKFSLEQLNHLIGLIYESWKTETILIQEKLIELLGSIGRECQKDSAARVLEILWDMAHEDRLSRSMLDHLLRCHLRVFSEGRSPYEALKRDYCLKCMTDLQRKQGWLVPAIRHLNELLRHDSTNTFKRSEQDLVSLLVNKHDLILALIQSLSTCQLDVWKKTHGQVTIDTLVDGRFTHEESIKSHLDLLSFLLKKGSLFLILKRSEELWDTLIVNENASSFDRELGLNWFITCVEDLNRDSQMDLFEKRVSKLDPIRLSPKGYACFKLYFERCNLERWSQSRNYTYNSNASHSSHNEVSDYYGVDELWKIISCVSDDSLANDATRFLLDLYYTKQPNRTRPQTAQSVHECFLTQVYTRLSSLLSSAVPSASTVKVDYYASLQTCAEQLLSTTPIKTATSTTPSFMPSNISPEADHALWLQNIERLLMITEEYIHIVEHEPSPRAHITSFHGLEYQIKIVLGELGKTNCPYDIALVHSNDTLQMLRTTLGFFYKVSAHDVHISIQNTRPLPQSYDHLGPINNAIALPSSSSTSPTSSSSPSSNSNNNNVLGTWLNSKYLHQVHITPGTTIYVKILGATYNQPTKSANTEPVRLHLSAPPRASEGDNSKCSIPSSMLGDNTKVHDVLYTLSYLNNKAIHKRIRNLLSLMPSDARILEILDSVSMAGANSCSIERRQSTDHPTNSIIPIDPKQAIQQVFNFGAYSPVQIMYNLEILSSRISPLSNSIGIKQSSKLFRQDFIEQSGVEFLFKLLHSLNHFIQDDYQYSLCEEMTIIVLQLIQLLLCGNNTQDDAMPSRPSSPIAISANDSTMDTIDFDFQATVEHLQFGEFVGQIKQLIFLGWAAAAGNIRLHEQVLNIKEQVKLDRHALLQQINANVFCRNNSKNSSSGDVAAANNVPAVVQFGICVKKDSILPLDAEIAEKVIDIVMHCFEKRPEFIATFLVQPFFADFLLEILIGTTSREVRQCALRNIIRLCKIATSACDIRVIIHQILLKARLPLWPSSSAGTRGLNQKLLSQSIEYFDLRCQLTENLTKPMQAILNIDATQILTEELNWLSNYTMSSNSNELRTIDNILFMGHLRFIRTLLTCANINKTEFGLDFIRLLLDQFLFPASKNMSSPMAALANNSDLNDSMEDAVPEPKCSTSESRLAAYDVLVELVRNCRTNLKVVVDDLIELHHRPILEKQTEWEFMPQVNPRASCGLVGLYNGGATCYMNSILQQLYMLPQISEHILSVHDDLDTHHETKKNGDSTLFCQLQQVFGHLMESKMQYYSPEALWKVFRLWGQEINVREQQDAFDFFTAMTDQIDEYLKSIKQEEIFRKQFEGIFCNQMICTNGCRHRYEGEERFMALNVAVKVDSLNESLNQFVKGEVLDGNNAYFCAKCQEKRTTIKRLCIKKLPPLLCIQMKRFGFDWENNRALKFDDYFKFPPILNMEPYTLDGVNKRESFVEHDDLVKNTNGNSHNDSLINSSATGDHQSSSRSSSSLPHPASAMPTINYELIGIVIHSGQANAGHYYSFIKDIRRRHSSNTQQWYRFNDTSVEEIQLTEQMLEEECFGGSFRVHKDNNNSTEERTRFWNAYMLIYQCIEPSKLLPPPPVPTSPNPNRTVPVRTIPGSAVRVNRSNQRDSLSQLADLVVQSENSDLFKIEKSSIPSSVLACVKDENLEFLKNRDTYCDDYFHFVAKLANVCFDDTSLPLDMEMIESENDETSYELCTKLALNFLFNTHLRTHRRLRKDSLQQWVQLLSRLFAKNQSSCLIFYQLLFDRKENGLKLFLLDCPIDDIRSTFEQLCEHVLQASYAHLTEKSPQIEESNMNENQETLIVNMENNLSMAMKHFVEQLISLLDKAVVEQVKHSQAYFQLVHTYAKMNKNTIDSLLQLNTFARLMNFLLGENIDNRRWNSGQAKDFGIIHEIIALLVLASYSANRQADEKDKPLNNEMKVYFQGKWSNRYLKEICYAFQEVSASQLLRTIELMELLAMNNEALSEQLIRIILQSIAQAHTNDLKSLFKFLGHILLIDDPLQTKRLQLIFEGITEPGAGDNCHTFNGLYALIRTSIETEQRRAYQTVKFLTNMSNKNNACKDYFSSTVTQWESAINWLKQQMQTSWQWSPAQNVSNEDTDTRSFQRTRSAQYTLEQAQSLLQRTSATTSNGNLNNEPSASELMELNDTHSQSSSQSTLVGSD